MLSRVFRTAFTSVAVLGVVVLAGCTTTAAEPEVDAAVVTIQPAEGTTSVIDADAATRAIETSRLLVESAPAVVVAEPGEDDAILLAAQAAVGLGVPLLLDEPASSGASASPTVESTDTATPTGTPAPSPLLDEIDRLGAATVVAVGDVDGDRFGDLDMVASAADAAAVRDATGVDVSDDAERLTASAIADLPAPEPSASTASASASAAPLDPMPEPAQPVESTIALSTDAAGDAASLATARAVGVPVAVLPADDADPLRSSAAITALHDAAAHSTLLLGEAFGELPDPDYSVRAAATGVELPGGGQHLFADRLFVALYGAPDAPVLGVLGEQDVTATIERAKKTAAPYDGLTDRTVVPTLEVIATVAAGAAGGDGNFSNELPSDRLEPYIDAAAEAGMYVVLDLQPGRTDFLTQAKLYEKLLAKPNVGLALDPEWRLEPDQVHLRQIGSVSADEINSVSDWLADLVNRESLPPKMLVLHQFRLDMIENRQDVDMSHPELELLIHADGQGSQPDKQATWRALHGGAPEGMAWGWKNFYDEDTPMLSPEQTMREVTPEVDLVTYQ
ncbi:hypothetical protein CLV49_1870 [Labedella gwakjiensis]|uniref:Lipoprotein n=1 Tax=Labedella gwakjiensis TaxID=390269 RepID=A0A2P8GWB6_9MICO|nr:hypothetical protein [Labedella gwakjiensis]PSL38253.1 hypothetical protein CLV49_1870 [Labedella gwakjiensis]RUQ87208.1 hypothetical protein ELQ93_09870 [Labedella gwakjiensis]